MDSETTDFPTLYATNKTGKKQVWNVYVENSTIIRKYGQVGGKIVTVERKCEVKNEGKKNATTAEEQARFEAQKYWLAQLKKDYKPDDCDLLGVEFYQSVTQKINSQGGNLHNIRGTKNEVSEVKEAVTRERGEVNMPMKAETFSDYWQHRKGGKETGELYFNPEGCFIQPKLDGVRALGFLDKKGECHLTSRTSKEFVFLMAIRREIEELLVSLDDPQRYKLDGEFYVHIIKDKKGNVYLAPDRFRLISGACRSVRKNPAEQEYLIEFHIFDLIDTQTPNMTFENRHKTLLKIFKGYQGKKLKLVETNRLENPTAEELWEKHNQYVENHYEGAILRDKDNIYSSRREPTLLKMKPLYDAEFKIVGAKSGEGTEEGCVVYELETEKGYKFTCRPRGTFADRQRAYKEIKKDIGKMYTVYYQEMDKDTGIPIHIRGKDIRYD